MSKEETNPVNQADNSGTVNSDNLAAAIKKATLNGKFVEAEALREKLIEIDPLNLKLIVSTGEAIEEQKTKLLDKDHLAIWDNLYESLTEEETNCLFYSMEPVVIESNKLLQVQGKISNRLFFIDSGKVVLFYRKDDKNNIVVQLGRGDIVGESSFFEISLCTLSAATQAETKLYILTRRATEKWQKEHPDLSMKIAQFCRKQGKSAEAIASSNLDRRSATRYPISGVAAAVVQRKDGSGDENSFKGALSNISQFGLCFDIKCSRQEAARALLAAELNMSLVFDGHEEKPLHLKGQITKVSYHFHNDYSVHVKFLEPIEAGIFKTMPCDWSVKDGSEEKP